MIFSVKGNQSKSFSFSFSGLLILFCIKPHTQRPRERESRQQTERASSPHPLATTAPSNPFSFSHISDPIHPSIQPTHPPPDAARPIDPAATLNVHNGDPRLRRRHARDGRRPAALPLLVGDLVAPLRRDHFRPPPAGTATSHPAQPLPNSIGSGLRRG